MSFLTIKNLFKSYPHINKKGQKINVLNGISLEIEKGEFITIFGPNGCGKTTLLNIVAGLIDSDSGYVKIEGKNPNEFHIGYVFQNFSDSLLPWRSTLDNIAFPLELRNYAKSERYSSINKFLREMNIDISLNSYPYQLSSGQQQLTAILRALVANPKILILDEPFGSLDFTTRLNLENELLKIWKKTKTTILFVSHDIEESIFLGDKLILLGKRPAKIIKIIKNTLPRPRSLDIYESDSFFKIKNNTLRIFREKIMK